MTLRINNACQVFSVECVSKMKSILSLYYRGLCFRLTHFSCDDFDNMSTLSYFHPQIGSMNTEPLFRIRSLNNDMRSMSCYILPVLIYQRQGYIALMLENHPEKIWRYQSEKRYWTLHFKVASRYLISQGTLRCSLKKPFILCIHIIRFWSPPRLII